MKCQIGVSRSLIVALLISNVVTPRLNFIFSGITESFGSTTKCFLCFADSVKRILLYGFREFRFHDLRHSYAGFLLANGMSMKEVQDWLGHSTFKITADTYAHLDFKSKLNSADALSVGTAFAKISKPSIKKAL